MQAAERATSVYLVNRRVATWQQESLYPSLSINLSLSVCLSHKTSGETYIGIGYVVAIRRAAIHI